MAMWMISILDEVMGSWNELLAKVRKNLGVSDLSLETNRTIALQLLPILGRARRETGAAA
jgi:hypothetical protein